MIGRRKYEALKALDLENITDDTMTAFNLQFKELTVSEALGLISEYEANHQYLSKEAKESRKAYFDRIHQPQKQRPKKEMTKEWLWKQFVDHYRANEGVAYSKDTVSVENIKPLIYYFIGDLDHFSKCGNVSKVSVPSLKKGLLIIGGYGNGKTSVMRALENSLRHTNVRFRGYTTNQLVSMYDGLKIDEKAPFDQSMKKGTLYFDDVLTERDASNFGKVNLMKEILEERYNRKLRTYVTCNYREDAMDDLESGLAQFGERYGSRMYDRLFSMFNIVEFKGKSYRR